MATRLILGRPPQHIINWIISHRQTIQPDELDNSKFGLITQALENCLSTDFSNLNYVGSDPVLIALKAGQEITDFQYKTDGITDYNTTWINLGFNASIPEYVKYRTPVGSGYKHVWLKSTNSDGILSDIKIGDAVYTRSYSVDLLENVYEDIGKTVASIDGSFTYGNNNTYSVPMTVIVDGTEYTFCGYNITLNSKCRLYVDGKRLVSADDGVSYSGALGTLWRNSNGSKQTQPYYISFDVGGKSNATYGRNRWGCSDMRKWMNGTWEQSLV